jgi:CRISPR-associated protein Cmr1
MSRSLVPCPAMPPVAGARPQQTGERTYDIEVITPMFGGSAIPRKVDTEHPIRISEIRGHLRFWWRATRGAAFTTVSDLRAREGKVWGSTQSRSEVRIELTISKPGQPCQIDGYPGSGYALFPFQEQKHPPLLAAQGQLGVCFQLRLRYPAHLDADIAAAMWAWVNFGGIGARTRRGAGALYCGTEAPASRNVMPAWQGGRVKEFGLLESPVGEKEWPVLVFVYGYRPKVSRNATRDVAAAWAESISVLSDFRQGVPPKGIGRNKGAVRKHGRSRWPEADSVRALTGESEIGHQTSKTLANPAVEPGFPRAELGLPIVLKFFYRHYGDILNDCDITPVDPVRHVGASRMASPVVLRPLKTRDGQFHAMIVRLSTKRPLGIQIDFKNKTVSLPPGTLLDQKAICRPNLATYPSSPMQGRTPRGSAVEALLAFAKERGFQEVL